MKSPEKLKQIKITGFFVKSPEGKVRINRKRKNSDVVEEPKKKSMCHDSENLFDDFFDEIFLSPKKESPKKVVLGSNSAWESGLSFNSPKKCKVTKTCFNAKNKYEQVLTVRDEKTKKEGTCTLRDVWTCHEFATDDVVSIHATESEGSWIVDNKTGYVILHPDIIVSSTVLAKSMFCMRQGILSHFFKESGIEKNKRMLIGRLVHELFQRSLRNRTDFGDVIQSIITSRENFRDFLFNDVNVSDIRKEMEAFVPKIENFLEIYLDKKTKHEGRNFNGSIEDVLDIEEVVKSPILGLQGRVDVTVNVKSQNTESVAPLELKTGKASFSAEHRSQVALYVVLMKELGRKVDAGLLLYLKDGVIEEIKPQRDEIRNLFLLRNHFVSYCKSIKHHVLPEPIPYIKNCDKCAHLRVCRSYLNDDNKPLGAIPVPDLKPTHVEYFLNWSRMLWLENEDGSDEVSGLRVQSATEVDDKYNYVFTHERQNAKIHRCGTYVQVRNLHNRVCAGRITEMTESTVTISTDNAIDQSDVYTMTIPGSKFLSFYLSNLGWFLEEKYSNLREIIINGKLPTFEKNINKREFIDKCLNELVQLNKDQQKAVLKALMCKDYLLIKGPPGTGKTQTVVSLIRIFLAVGKKVLLAGHTHSSVDNVLFRLKDVEYLRLGSLKNIHEDMYPSAYEKLAGKCRDVDDLRRIFNRRLVASTCMGIDLDFIEKYKFDVCIVDESSQVLQPEVLRPLFCAEKFILVGDDDQLPPIVRNPEAKKLGMGKSLFERLTNDHATVKLKLQYRMNRVINSLANAIAYDGMIECANEKIAYATIKTPKIDTPWIARVLSDDLEKSVTFIDTSSCFKSRIPTAKRCSSVEVNIIVKLVTYLLTFMKNDSIGIITPFWDQVALLKKKLAEEKLKGIELNTVDQYQGRDKGVILFSCGKENDCDRETTEVELLSDKRRLTVAVTRAKHKLIIIGDRRTVGNYKPFEKLLKNLAESQVLVLKDGQSGFFWKDYVDSLESVNNSTTTAG